MPEQTQISILSCFSNQLLKRMQEQGSEHRSLIFMLNTVFGKNVLKVFTETVLHWTGTVHTNYLLSYGLFFVYAFVYFHAGHDANITLFCFYFLFLYIPFSFCLCVIFYFNCLLETIIIHHHIFLFLIFWYIFIYTYLYSYTCIYWFWS